MRKKRKKPLLFYLLTCGLEISRHFLFCVPKINGETIIFLRERGGKHASNMILLKEKVTTHETFVVWSLSYAFHLAKVVFWRKLLRIYPNQICIL